jgi:hypothetical protein
MVRYGGGRRLCCGGMLVTAIDQFLHSLHYCFEHYCYLHFIDKQIQKGLSGLPKVVKLSANVRLRPTFSASKGMYQTIYQD